MNLLEKKHDLPYSYFIIITIQIILLLITCILLKFLKNKIEILNTISILAYFILTNLINKELSNTDFFQYILYFLFQGGTTLPYKLTQNTLIYISYFFTFQTPYFTIAEIISLSLLFLAYNYHIYSTLKQEKLNYLFNQFDLHHLQCSQEILYNETSTHPQLIFNIKSENN